jgi:ABC-type transport system substrate-binding protein
MEVATLLNRLGEEDDTSNIDLMGWGWGESDLLYMMTDGGSGIGRYQPEAYRTLVSQARRVTDLEERAGLYFEAMKVMLADAAMVPLWTTLGVTGVRAEIEGFKLGPQGSYVYADAHVRQ